MPSDAFLTLGAVAFGWLLNEVGHLRRKSDLQREPLGRALADLLEIRHYLRGVDLMITEVRRRASITREELGQLRTAIQQFIPKDPGLPSRYDAALIAIAAYRPVLAFRLRSKEHMPTMFTTIRTLLPSDVASSEAQDYLDTFLDELGIGTLNEAIIDVAWEHGLDTWWSIRRRLKKPDTLPAQLQEFLDKLAAPPGSLLSPRDGPT
jgi:hypothetical protein